MLSRNVRSSLKRISAAVPKGSGLRVSGSMARSVRGFLSVNAAPTMPLRGVQGIQFRRFASHTVKVPEMAESITEGTLSAYTKNVGDYVNLDETIATIETDKIDVEVNASVAGTITELLVEVEETVEVGQDLVKIEEGEAPAASEAPKEESKEAAPKEESKKEEPKKEAPKKEEPKKETPKKEAPKESKKDSKSEASTFTHFSRNEERVKMNRMRLRIAERLKESQNTAASLTTFNEVDMSNLMEMRKLYKDELLDKTGIKLGFMGAFAKASTLAAKEIPAVNASIENNDTLVFRDYTDISIAVATPKGLVTPIVRNAESLSILDIEKEISNLGKKARDGKLTLEDMTGGTFTISNGGVFGSLYGTPIINMPQTAVLGLHGVKERPVTVNGQVVSRPMMYLALTYDHRVLDGREAVTFLKTVKELIEDPRKMLLLQ
ncbi:putative dihydrolipoyllysine-residue succinyltransferase component of 2-oxoglutarate dehydrogenase complex mitochondrial precursor [Suhomyces tanzawaensis NRRL Y-17324]|uniref:dihydrolipoyllysine-residue succinyltransferase n=1 Tax=Suhomyces tanzawaensis NRRL Y-17324 TaxID=984487 RepID=A0A1E4SL69_9ASCO|nr:putative dihydrolipoyllysine-residue succinyltransferase component of 2-oxoglutarate dehydrogenase complex mitochondrial precursor [Suhomyces tanzawaensis NRRL Y-17324]ODV80244.1 putative dihydrolipoyllysine-residue succinyltransferase component of 2-oxoglutarate dehydrogenase complex mitochondrial precursor [Suhomyces tanzawaensis NRRL Y-17324]